MSEVISPDEAKKAVEQHRIPDWRDRRLKDLSRAGGALRIAGQRLFSGRVRQERVVGEALAALADDDRRKLLRILFPKLDPWLERAWQLQTRLPYQTGYHRLPFRAPGSPEYVTDRRAYWLWGLLYCLDGLDPELTWLAAWGPHAGESYWLESTGPVFAAAIDAGGPEGEEVFTTLRESASGTHEIGVMGRHVVSSLLCSERREGWEFVGNLLLAAQREEGLRQAIMERADESHPGAFRHLLGVVLDNDLVRFSSVVRAADAWLGLQWDAASGAEVERILTRVREYLDDERARNRALGGDEAADVYYALWTLATEDVAAAIPRAAAILAHDRAEVRFAAAHFLSRTSLLSAWEPLLPLIDDPDPRVATLAVLTLSNGQLTEKRFLPVFDSLARNLDRFPKKKEQPEPIVWPWCRPSMARSDVAEAMVRNLGDGSVSRMLPAKKYLGADGRDLLAMRIRNLKELPPDARAMLLEFAGDTSEYVRNTAHKKLRHVRIRPEEAEQLEGLLHRKAEGLRRGVLQLLGNQPADRVLESADRLIAAKQTLKRQAGLELIRGQAEAKKKVPECRARARKFTDERAKITRDEQVHLDAILGGEEEALTLDNGLGLFDPAECASVPDVRARSVKVRTKAAVACLESLDALVHEHREERITGEGWNETIPDLLLGESGWRFPAPKEGVAVEDDRARFPVAEVWDTWDEARPNKLRDRDGLERVRAIVLITMEPRKSPQNTSLLKSLFGPKPIDIRYAEIVERILRWLLVSRPPEGFTTFLLDAVEDTLSRTDVRAKDWAEEGAAVVRLAGLADRWRKLLPDHWGDAARVRFWRLLRWMEDRHRPSTVRTRRAINAPNLGHCVDAFRAGVATKADLFRQLFANRGQGGFWHSRRFLDLLDVSGRAGRPEYANLPEVAEVFEACRDRILEVELARGDAPTAATHAARNLRDLPGIVRLVRVLRAMKRGKFRRGWDGSEDRYGVLSHFVRVSRPVEGDTRRAFAAAVEKEGITEKRLLELALYAPQWAAHVEAAVGWKGIEDATWWIHAHTKDDNWSVEQAVREEWEATVRERTPLTGDALEKGTVDVRWFHRVYKTLKRKRWLALMEAAKYASSSGGHKRAELFADAMLGRVTKTALKERIEEKRHQDAVRAYGLLPLARGKARDRDLLSRYQLMEEFIRTSRQFGAQRQESEKLCVRVGQENLARTAGYPDPLRLRWAMEREAVADLAEGPIVVEAAGAEIALSIDEFGEPRISVTKGEKTLKSVPAKAKKDPAVKALSARRTALRRQRSRIRKALEEMMIRGDDMDGAELRDLLEHPLIAPMFRSLVFVGRDLAGYPVEGGQALEDHAGHVEPIGTKDRLRIAHPDDLLAAGDWHEWQRDCFARERIQPFKQVFRELYPITDAERDEKVTRRYAGHQVQPRQAVALLGGRGWVVKAEEGVRRTWHDEGITAYIEFEEYFTTPADVEGLTVERVGFTKSGKRELLPIADLPPRLFSETMRDLDLMVSVAHSGGVDPEATASTVEMRTSLLRETLMVLGVGNVRLDGTRALIDGTLGNYSVHLGSAVVHILPGGFLCIVPVHSQHRGRMFLPFADDDPKTAEVISKVLLLARDDEISDPTILEQLRRRG